MTDRPIRDFSKRKDGLRVPDLVRVQRDAYDRFLQLHTEPDKRDPHIGVESLLREIFPIESYDGTMRLEYLSYSLDEPRYTPDECRELRLTYGMPFRIRVRFHRDAVEETPEEDIYLGEIPIMAGVPLPWKNTSTSSFTGGGEFIVNGSERVIVSQLHRSPGVDFSIASSLG